MDEYIDAKLGSSSEKAAFGKLDGLYAQFQQQKGAVDAAAKACVVSGPKS